MTNDRNHGGVRPGSGRPSTDRKNSVTIRLTDEGLEMLNLMTDNKTEYIENLIKQDYRDWQESSYCDELSDICNTSCTAYELGICPYRGTERVMECNKWEGSIIREKGRYPTPKELGWKVTPKQD